MARPDRLRQPAIAVPISTKYAIIRALVALMVRVQTFVANKLRDWARGYPLLTIGEHTYGRPHVLRWDKTTKVSIGRFCSIAKGVTIFAGGNHRVDWVTTYPLRAQFNLPGANQDGHPASKGDIIIGSDVWIGEGAVILSGVQIGHGAVIGARAVVAKSVPPYAVVVGNPARVVRMRFTEEQIGALLRIQWWNWPLERILRHIDLLASSSVDDFIREA